MPSFLAAKSFIAMAHRGSNTKAENSVQSFKEAVELGYTYIETDVRATKDGVLVVLHDASLKRVSGVQRPISELTWEEASAQIKLSDGSRIPRMIDILEQFPTTYFNIDPKSDDAVDPLIEVIKSSGSTHRVCIGSFSRRRVRRLQQGLGPSLCTSPGGWAMATTLIFALVAPGRQSSYQCLQVPMIFRPRWFGSWLVRRIHAAGLDVHVWTVNDRSTIERALDVNVDGIISDDIVLLRGLLERRGLW